MTTPPSRLSDRLVPQTLIDVRGIDGRIEATMSYTDALAEIIKGLVEGVGPRSGRIDYLRRLKPEACMQPLLAPVLEGTYLSDSTAVANARIGVYREELRILPPDSVNPEDGVAVAHCYAFQLLRGSGI